MTLFGFCSLVFGGKNLPSFVYVSVFRAPCMINSSLKWQVFPAWNLFLEKPCKAKSLKNQNHLVPRPFFIRTSTLTIKDLLIDGKLWTVQYWPISSSRVNVIKSNHQNIYLKINGKSIWFNFAQSRVLNQHVSMSSYNKSFHW